MFIATWKCVMFEYYTGFQLKGSLVGEGDVNVARWWLHALCRVLHLSWLTAACWHDSCLKQVTLAVDIINTSGFAHTHGKQRHIKKELLLFLSYFIFPSSVIINFEYWMIFGSYPWVGISHKRPELFFFFFYLSLALFFLYFCLHAFTFTMYN